MLQIIPLRKSHINSIIELNIEFESYLNRLSRSKRALYHSGFDPDEMQGKVIYLIDLYVREKARGKGVGKALIEKLQDDKDSLGLYFGVWRKNFGAVKFYKKIGAEWCEDVPFMKLIK